MNGDLKAIVKSGLSRLAYPLRRYFEPRFGRIDSRLEEMGAGEREVMGRLTDLEQTASAGIAGLRGRIEEAFAELTERQAAFERRIYTDVETTAELFVTLQRLTASLTVRLDELMSGELAGKLLELHPEAADRGALGLIGRPLAELGEGAAHLLNWASGHTGPAAEAGLWFNQPLTVEHRKGEVVLGHVNERIIEVPFALGAAASLPFGSSVVDVGSAESTFALSLAALGLEVTAVEPRGYPLTHPRLKVVSGGVEEWEGPEPKAAAIFCVSTIEHLGVGAYGQKSGDPGLDRKVMARFREWLAADGELVLTTPFGEWSVDDFQRVYDRAHLDALLEGWKVLDVRIGAETADRTWEVLPAEPDADYWAGNRKGVAMMRATPER